MSNATHTLAFEIGTEEIPAFDLQKATDQFRSIIPAMLDDNRIPHGAVKICSSPRRLIALVSDVAEETEAVEEEHKGPKTAIAFDAEGRPTKAAEGFARGKGVSVDALEVREEGGVEYVFARRSIPSQKTSELLRRLLRDAIDSIAWPKSMKWGTHRELFTRPVRWVVALLGSEVIPFEYAGFASGNETYGHRVLAGGAHPVAAADDLLEVVRAAYVVPSEEEREAVIRKGVEAIEAALAPCTVVLPPKTLTEVVNLSEYPTVMLGSFDAEFLKVPEEIIVDAMLMHQRYFPIYDNGKLTNKFVIVSNGDPAFESTIVDGNERVVAARLYDAKFFYDEDLKTPLEDYVERLDEVVFQEQLGTMRDKTDRVGQLASKLCLDAAVSAAEAEDVARAAKLAKADLVTNAVVEFTSVQGVMGSYYAAAGGENEQVAVAIAEHYRPRFAGDEPPSGTVGRIVAIADKLDTICGLFALDQAPTGSSDPFALRRAALGVIAIMRAGIDISLKGAVADALDIYLESGLQFNKQEVLDAVIDFFVTRVRVMLHEDGHDLGVIDAVLASGVVEPQAVIERTGALTDAITAAHETFEDLATAYARANNLRDAEVGTDVDASLFDAAERALDEAIVRVGSDVAVSLEEGLYPAALEQLAQLRGPIDEFFESTMIMDEDAALRRNRLALLNRFVGVFAGIADFSLIQHKK